MRNKFLLITVAAACFAAYAAVPEVLHLDGDISPVHDPAVIRAGGTWYVFSTGAAHPGHIPIRCSIDLRHWKLCGCVFEQLPDWTVKEIPGARSLWAPDISYFKGAYRLYYAVSTFGSNRSAIGLATNATLDPASPNYKWTDEGPVIESHRDDDWNAIDPNLATDKRGRQWLVFGSFWGGIKMRRIDSATGKLSSEDERLYSVAARPHDPGKPDTIEAPFIVRHDSWYYLFVSFDYCCRGAKSTYNVAVGRSRKITGPYADAAGKPMMKGGGTAMTSGTERWRGPGHEAVLLGPPRDIMLFHAYDGTTGRPSLQISSLVWENGWPKAGVLP